MRKCAYGRPRWLIVAGVIICIVAFGLRLLNVLLYLPHFIAHKVFLDSEVYVQGAELILEGGILEGGAYYMSPFYSYFILLAYASFDQWYMTAIRVLQCLLGAMTCGFIMGITRRAFGSRQALVAGLMACFYGPLIFFDAMILPTSAAVFLISASVYFLLSARRGRAFFLSGFFLGLAATARPNSLLLLPVFVFAAYFLYKGIRKSPRRLRAVLVLAGILTVIVPVTVRNYLASRDFVLISSNGGLNFYIGNNPETQVSFTHVPGISPDPSQQLADARRIAESFMGRPLKDSEVSAFWFRKGFSFLLEQPRWASIVYLMKVYSYWHYPEVQLNVNYYFFQRFMPLFAIPFLNFHVVGPLSLTGLFFLFKRSRRSLILAALALTLTASVILFFVTGRFRLSVIPLLIPFAAGAIVFLFDRIRSRSVRHICPLAVTLLFFGVVLNIPVPKQPQHFSYNTLGIIYLQDD
ncbi:ArnT family glycosyltransferase, partial [Acidobacteriota bacterium]